MKAKPELTGIVLAGGKSTRMGRDKASLPWGSTDLLNTVLSLMTPVCGRLIVVSNAPRHILAAETAVVGDNFAGCGPLAGIEAGLTASTTDYNFVAACDMPYLSGAAAAYLAAAAAGFDAAVPYIGGHYHPLHAVYRRSCLAVVRAALAVGQYRVSDFYGAIRLRRVAAAELAAFEPSLAMLRNLNSPADLPSAE